MHCRVLIQLQTEIHLLEQKLAELDRSDASPGSINAWRLETADYNEKWDPAQQILLKELRKKLIEYGTLPV